MKLKFGNIVIFILALVLLFIIMFWGQIRSFFSKTSETATVTPPLTASTVATVTTSSSSVSTIPAGHRFLGDELISMVEGQDYVLTPPAGAAYAQFQVQENPVLMRMGASPVNGGFLCEIHELHTLENSEEISKAKFRTKAGAATLVINYFSA